MSLYRARSQFEVCTLCFEAFTLILTSLLLCACGFNLRGEHPWPLDLHTLTISPNTPYTPLQKILREDLRLQHVTVLSASEKKAQPAVPVLSLTSEKISRETLAVGTDGQIRQILLHYRLTYTLTYPRTATIPAQSTTQTIAVERVLTVNLNQILGQNAEEATAIAEMRADAAQQLMRRLASTHENHR